MGWDDYYGGGVWIDSTSVPIIGGSQSTGNSIYDNNAVHGNQLYRFGEGTPIDATYNFLGSCPPNDFDVYPQESFITDHCLDSPISLEISAPKTIPVLPAAFSLFDLYPNPFNPTTTIEFSVPRNGLVTLTVYDLLGREVHTILNQPINPGHHTVQWNASNVPSGIYFVRMESDGSDKPGR